jgi:hypothetical protein
MCSVCGALIPEGMPMWSVTVYHEVMHGEEMEVLDAEAYLVFCDACGQARDFTKISVPAKQYGKWLL